MRRLTLAVPLVLTLAACGPNGDKKDAPPSKAPPALTETEKADLLAALPAPYNTGDLDNGRRVFARCRACHTIGRDGPDMAGPNLYGVFGRKAGERPRYNYSNTLRTADFVWDAQALDRCLTALPHLIAGEMDKATALIHTSKPPRPKPPRPAAPPAQADDAAGGGVSPAADKG